MNTYAIILLFLSFVFISLLSFRNHINCWLYYHRRKKKIAKIAKAYEKTCKAMGRSMIEAYQAGIAFDSLGKAMNSFADAAERGGE